MCHVSIKTKQCQRTDKQKQAVIERLETKKERKKRKAKKFNSLIAGPRVNHLHQSDLTLDISVWIGDCSRRLRITGIQHIPFK